MKAGDDIPKRYDLSSLRYTMSVGEPLNPEAVVWGEQGPRPALPRQLVADRDRLDHDRELPGRCAIRPGSMGRPMLGIEPGIIDDEGNEVPPGEEGDLALRPGWPSMFRTYWHNEEMYNSRFRNGWYITGDRARRDADGYFWFIGRADDVINTAGHLVGPFEVESALDRAPGRRRGRRHRQAGPGRDGDREGVRRAQGRLRAERAAAPRAHRLLARQARRRRRAARDRLRAVACPRRAPARSCAACSRPASSACRRATRARWRTKALFLVSDEGFMFHRLGCLATARMLEKNIRVIRDADSAMREGFKPCQKCRPVTWSRWRTIQKEMLKATGRLKLLAALVANELERLRPIRS